MDIAGGYIKAVTERLPDAGIVFDRFHVQKLVSEALENWLAWANRSKLKPFVTVARTIQKYKEGILAYIKERHTNARIEGMNNRLRMIARRAFGFQSKGALSSMSFLCCGGIELNPPLP
jgi:transposase